MFDLTAQERKVIIFFLAIALLGLCINSLVKTSHGMSRIFKVNGEAAKADINQASLQDLHRMSGINLNLSGRIIAHRNSRGGFSDMEELKEIKGIGEFRCEKLKRFFAVK